MQYVSPRCPFFEGDPARPSALETVIPLSTPLVRPIRRRCARRWNTMRSFFVIRHVSSRKGRLARESSKSAFLSLSLKAVRYRSRFRKQNEPPPRQFEAMFSLLLRYRRLFYYVLLSPPALSRCFTMSVGYLMRLQEQHGRASVPPPERRKENTPRSPSSRGSRNCANGQLSNRTLRSQLMAGPTIQ